MRSPSLRHRLLADGFAVEFAGLDLATTLPEPDFARLRALWLRHKVAVLRGQRLDDDALLRLTLRFGRPFVHVRSQYHSPTHPEIMFVSNLQGKGEPTGALGNDDLVWHSDQAYSRLPVFGTLLYALEVPAPEQGGTTYFADLTAAFEALPAALRQRIDGLRCRFSMAVTKRTQGLRLPPEQRARMPDVSHPLVRTHPLLGSRSLYLSPGHVAGVDGRPSDEGEALLADLTAWAERPRFVYAHRWQPGDVVFWDNVQVMHRRDGFAADARRLLKRTGWELPDEQAVPV